MENTDKGVKVMTLYERGVEFNKKSVEVEYAVELLIRAMCTTLGDEVDVEVIVTMKDGQTLKLKVNGYGKSK